MSSDSKRDYNKYQWVSTTQKTLTVILKQYIVYKRMIKKKEYRKFGKVIQQI